MKKIFIILFILINKIILSQTSIRNLYPHPHAQLDVSSSAKGVLIPRITLVALNDPSPIDISIGSIPESLLVYHTGMNPSIKSGYYY